MSSEEPEISALSESWKLAPLRQYGKGGSGPEAQAYNTGVSGMCRYNAMLPVAARADGTVPMSGSRGLRGVW